MTLPNRAEVISCRRAERAVAASVCEEIGQGGSEGAAQAPVSLVSRFDGFINDFFHGFQNPVYRLNRPFHPVRSDP